MNIQKIAVEKLKPASYDPRKDLKPGDSEYERIKCSIKEFGFVKPLVVNKDMTVIGGHQGLKILIEEGVTEVDCVVVDLDKSQEKALNIALNKITGIWDMPLLHDVIKSLEDTIDDITITGFEAAEIDELFSNVHDKDIQEDDFDTEAEVENIEEPITQSGDIWQLGNHRLICADSTDLESYQKLMDGKKADLCVTDPPYNVDYTGATKDKLKIKNDKMNNDTFLKFLEDSYSCIYDSLKDGAGIYVFHADTEGLNFRKAFQSVGFHLANVCIWVKQSLVLGRSDYQWQHEPILYGWKPTGKHNWCSDRKQTTVWEFDRPSRNGKHPTMKPVALCSYPIKNSTNQKAIVLDPFGGSGSTLIACEQLNRCCRMIELDERYCDVIVKRYLQTTEKDDVFLIRNSQKIPIKELDLLRTES